MGEGEKNDYDSIAHEIGEIESIMVGGTHEGLIGDSATITLEAWFRTVTRLKRLEQYVNGLAEAHRDVPTLPI